MSFKIDKTNIDHIFPKRHGSLKTKQGRLQKKLLKVLPRLPNGPGETTKILLKKIWW